jgi:hypothetical protein
MTVESALAEKFEALRPLLDERQWRLLLGAAEVARCTAWVTLSRSTDTHRTLSTFPVRQEMSVDG